MNARFALLTAALLGGGSYLNAQTPLLAPQAKTGVLQPAGAPQPPKDSPDDLFFDLDFPGGTPIELVKAMEKAIGKPLNVVVSAEKADFKLQGLKLKRVNAELAFMAMEMASANTVSRTTGTFVDNAGKTQALYQGFQESFGFRPVKSGGQTVWVFHYNKPFALPAPPMSCRFYQLGSYLQEIQEKTTLKVEDITTAIQTGWRMMKVEPMPELNFHKETQLLIVVGEQEHLAVIDDVLMALSHRQGGGFGGGFGAPPPPSTKSVPPAPPAKKNP